MAGGGLRVGGALRTGETTKGAWYSKLSDGTGGERGRGEATGEVGDGRKREIRRGGVAGAGLVAKEVPSVNITSNSRPAPLELRGGPRPAADPPRARHTPFVKQFTSIAI